MLKIVADRPILLPLRTEGSKVDTGRWTQLIDEHMTYRSASGHSPGTLRIRRHYLEAFARLHPEPFDVDLNDLAAFVAHPSWSPEARKSARASVAGFYRWAHRAGHVERDLALYLPAVRVPRPEPRPAPEAALVEALSRSHPRERLMLMLAAYAGLRCAEIARLRTDDLVDHQLRIVGKGGHVRTVPAHPEIEAVIATLSPGWLFPGVKGSISPGHVSKLLSAALGYGWTGHTLRHRFASRAYAAQRDIKAVSELLGHASVATTQRYVATPVDAKLAGVMAAGPIAA